MERRAYAFDEDGKRRANKAIRWVESYRDKQTRRQRRFSGPFDDIRVKPDSLGDTIPAYGVGKVSSIEDVDGSKVVKLAKPDTTFSRLYMVNGDSELADGAIGVSKNRPVIKLLCDAVPAIGDVFGPKDNQWSASKGYPGFTILGHLGDNIALARYESIDHLIGKPGSTVAKGSSGSFTIWLYISGAWSASSLSITATALGAECTSAKYAKLEWIAGQWICGPLECP